jgi:carbon starvation protein
MSLLWIVVPSALILLAAYFTYGSLLARLFQLDPKRKTPAYEMQDGVDYEPLTPSALFPQHFSAIAAAGPIVGPILAGLTFGWLPALIWILVGSILIGGIHDFASLVASIRHKARSIAEVVRDNMSRQSYLLFLSFIWIALIYIIVAFTDITAASFVGQPSAETGGVGGGAIASSSILYLILPVIMGLLMRHAKLPLWAATVIFVPLVGVAIWVGKYIPLDVQTLLGFAGDKVGLANARKFWDVALLLYCLVAGILPVWMLLQPRGHLGGYFLYAALGAGAIGLAFGGATAEYPMFRDWQVVQKDKSVATLFPFLFIMVACGACSGFHSLIASGTTSKQLRVETDAKPIAYGAMLLEGMVAIVSLCCVMMFASGSADLKGPPNQIYASGIARFMQVISTRREFVEFGRAFALMAFTTFVYDTLDVCTRLGRYILQELTGWHNGFGRWFGTALTAGIPLYFLLRHPSDAPIEVWRVFWNLFGASNQLLAALTLLGITVWLWRTRRAWWVWLVTGVPTVFMYVMSTWALFALTWPKFRGPAGEWLMPRDPVPWVGLVLMVLALLMLVEAIRIFLTLGSPPAAGKMEPAVATAAATS